MNNMPNVAKLLGVEINEVFTVKNEKDEEMEGVFRIEPYGLYRKQGIAFWEPSIHLEKLISGEWKLLKIPFKPRAGEAYWFVSLRTKQITWNEFVGRSFDYMAKATGNCFKSEDDAFHNRKDIYKKLTGKEWDDESNA